MAIVARMDEAIGKGETLSYWAFGSRLYVNNTFFNALRDDIFELADEQLLHRHLRHHPAADLQGG